MATAGLLDRLDTFLSAGANTDQISDFFALNSATLETLLSQGEEIGTDSRAGLETHGAYKRYAALVESLLDAFLREDSPSQDGPAVTEADLAQAVMSEWEADSYTYTSSAYIAAAIDFEAFAQLSVDMIGLQMYGDDDDERSTVAEPAADAHDEAGAHAQPAN